MTVDRVTSQFIASVCEIFYMRPFHMGDVLRNIKNKGEIFIYIADLSWQYSISEEIGL